MRPATAPRERRIEPTGANAVSLHKHPALSWEGLTALPGEEENLEEENLWEPLITTPALTRSTMITIWTGIHFRLS